MTYMSNVALFKCVKKLHQIDWIRNICDSFSYRLIHLKAELKNKTRRHGSSNTTCSWSRPARHVPARRGSQHPHQAATARHPPHPQRLQWYPDRRRKRRYPHRMPDAAQRCVLDRLQRRWRQPRHAIWARNAALQAATNTTTDVTVFSDTPPESDMPRGFSFHTLQPVWMLSWQTKMANCWL